MTENVSDIFRSTGQPTITYVKRDDGVLESRLAGYLDEAGQICLVTGPSKTGKTTLYKQVLRERGNIPLLVQCTQTKLSSDIWKEALEGVDFERTTNTSNSSRARTEATIELGAEGGWKWLAKITGKIQAALGTELDESSARQRILAEPHPDLLIPILKNTNYVLVIEDFHYLQESEKVTLFQQWKRFIDSEISIIVLGTSHRAVDIAHSNKDLLGRIAHIDVKQWTIDDLKSICNAGFQHLKAEASENCINLIAQESVGLPILTQQICLELFNNEKIHTTKEARIKKMRFAKEAAEKAFYKVAITRYSQFNSYYDTLIRGPREGARVYKTYELVLACFTIDPILFNLSRNEIDRRLDKLLSQNETRPPAASINSTLGALKKFQEKRGFQLLEWIATSSMLYIVEPAFLFYVRWRNRPGDPQQLDLFELLVTQQQ